MKTSLRLRARTLIALVLVLGAVPLVGSSSAQASVNSYERSMASYINSARHSHGLRSLTLGSDLSNLSRAHTGAMVRAGKLFHTSNLSYALRYYQWHHAGENVGYASSTYGIFKAFMASPGHKANILGSAYNRVGVGVVWHGSREYVTVTFLG